MTYMSKQCCTWTGYTRVISSNLLKYCS